MTKARLETPRIALGTWAWGDSGEPGDGYFGSGITEAGLEEIADRAHAAGLTLWDTAVVYGMGRAEAMLGKVLRRFSRNDYQLSTKFSRRPREQARIRWLTCWSRVCRDWVQTRSISTGSTIQQMSCDGRGT